MIIPVNLDEKYDVIVENGALDDVEKYLNLNRKVLVLTDDGVPEMYAEKVAKKCETPVVVTLKHGEESKNFDNFKHILSVMLENSFSRKDCVVAVGGGVVGDLTGLAVALYLRGLPFLQLPTTLLADVDSSVGGKVAVNHPRGKNLLGAFYQPELVVIDCDVLRTLDARQVGAGLGEVIKYGCIADAALFARIEALGSRKALEPMLGEVIARCCEIKARYVLEDPFDRGVRMHLNFGHTLAHALENAMGYGTLLHGEAVCIGMVAAARWGEALGVTPAGTAERIRRLLVAYDLPTDVPQGLSPAALAETMALDKKAEGASVRTILLDQIGACRAVPMAAAQLASLL